MHQCQTNFALLFFRNRNISQRERSFGGRIDFWELEIENFRILIVFRFRLKFTNHLNKLLLFVDVSFARHRMMVLGYISTTLYCNFPVQGIVHSTIPKKNNVMKQEWID